MRRPPPQLVLLDVDFTLIRPSRVFDAAGYAELGARFGAELDPGRYEQARVAAFHVWRADSLDLKLDVTTVDASAPDVSAPSSVGTAAELQTAVIGLLGKVMGGAATG